MKTLGIAVASALLAVFFVGLFYGWPSERRGGVPEAAHGLEPMPEPVRLDARMDAEDARHAFEHNFTPVNCLDALAALRISLESFRQMSRQHQSGQVAPDASPLPLSDWESQNLLLPKALDTLEATLRKQQYQLARLEFDLARRQYLTGEIDQDDLLGKEAACRQASQEFQAYWNALTGAPRPGR